MSALKPWAHMSVKEGEREGGTDRDGGGRQRRFLPVPPKGDKEGGGGGTAADEGGCAGDRIGEGELGSPEWLTPPASALRGGG